MITGFAVLPVTAALSSTPPEEKISGLMACRTSSFTSPLTRRLRAPVPDGRGTAERESRRRSGDGGAPDGDQAAIQRRYDGTLIVQFEFASRFLRRVAGHGVGLEFRQLKRAAEFGGARQGTVQAYLPIERTIEGAEAALEQGIEARVGNVGETRLGVDGIVAAEFHAAIAFDGGAGEVRI